MSAGRVEWLGVRPERGAPMAARARVEALADRGLAGDHASRRRGRPRQVTLIRAEHVAALRGRDGAAPPPALLRRNVVVSGLDLDALVGRRFRVGAALLEGACGCPPCRAMDAALGPGGREAMRGRGGLCARVIEGGAIRLRDAVGPAAPGQSL